MSNRPANGIISGSPEDRHLIRRKFDTADIIRAILFADKQSAGFIELDRLPDLKGPDDYRTLDNIFWFVKKNVRYQEDPAGREEVRSPGYLFQTQEGDCKSLSIAIAALCRAMGFPYKYRFVKQAGKGNFHHVYVVAETPDGSSRDTVILDAVNPRFNTEPRYVTKLDLKPGTKLPARIGAIEAPAPAILGLVLLFTILTFAD